MLLADILRNNKRRSLIEKTQSIIVYTYHASYSKALEGDNLTF